MELITQDNNIKKMPVPKERVYPVGRLDKESEGLIIMTNDGDLANMLMHPKFEHEKEYEVTIHEKLLPPAQTALEKGLLIEKEFYGGLKIKNIINKGKVCLITVILKQGKNRQIRKMFEALGYRVANLKRTRVAKLQLWTLPAGKWKYIDKKDI
jgi:pseudouridine synthase